MTRCLIAVVLAVAAFLAPFDPRGNGEPGAAAWHVQFGPAAVAAASPSPTPAAAGDPRSSGEGPGFVGTPLVAIGAVVGLGVLAVLVTQAYVRLPGGRRRHD